MNDDERLQAFMVFLALATAAALFGFLVFITHLAVA